MSTSKTTNIIDTRAIYSSSRAWASDFPKASDYTNQLPHTFLSSVMVMIIIDGDVIMMVLLVMVLLLRIVKPIVA